jgi:aldoxime dehydratase
MKSFPNMPDDWQAPAPAWKCIIGKDIAIAHIGVQGDDTKFAPFKASMRQIMAMTDGPDHVDEASFTDAAGVANHMYLCYWRNPADRVAWSQGKDFLGYWQDTARLTEKVGYWFESYHVPPERFETIWSHDQAHDVGIRSFVDVEGPMPEHGYWGAARDRLPISRRATLEQDPRIDGWAKTTTPITLPGRVSVKPPKDLCVIRSGQDWSQTEGAERQTYLSKVRPVLAEGMAYLSENPKATGCVSCRLADEVDTYGNSRNRSFGLAHFATLSGLEAWAKSHPTHLAILNSFYAMIAENGGQTALRLYHELFVVDPSAPLFEYVNCHDWTGLLPLSAKP